MICLIALFVFAIMGIFSATHRKLAVEAFNCVFRKITLRKCETGLDSRIKSNITGTLLRRTPRIGMFVYKHFEIISWAFTIIMVWSMVQTAISGYNYYLYGNCNGPQDGGFCIFDPTGENEKISGISNSGSCSVDPVKAANLTSEGFNSEIFPTFNKGAKNKVIFIGCYACQYTGEVYPDIKKLSQKNDVEFVFAHFPVKGNTDLLTDIGNCIYYTDSTKFMDFNDKIFALEKESLTNESQAWAVVESLGLNKEEISKCTSSNSTTTLRAMQSEEIKKTGIYGTPLVFVNGEPVVGPKPYRVYSLMLK